MLFWTMPGEYELGPNKPSFKTIPSITKSLGDFGQVIAVSAESALCVGIK